MVGCMSVHTKFVEMYSAPVWRCSSTHTSLNIVLAQRLLALSTVDYVHVLLASSPLDNSSDGPTGLDAIRAASEGVSDALFASAIELWRAVCRENGLLSEAETPRAGLVFRALGKRGGRG